MAVTNILAVVVLVLLAGLIYYANDSRELRVKNQTLIDAVRAGTPSIYFDGVEFKRVTKE